MRTPGRKNSPPDMRSVLSEAVCKKVFRKTESDSTAVLLFFFIPAFLPEKQKFRITTGPALCCLWQNTSELCRFPLKPRKMRKLFRKIHFYSRISVNYMNVCLQNKAYDR
jgi:hypothetical protein